MPKPICLIIKPSADPQMLELWDAPNGSRKYLIALIHEDLFTGTDTLRPKDDEELIFNLTLMEES